MRPDRWRLAAYALVVVAGAVGFWRQEMTINRLDTVISDNEAQACVDDWEDYDEDLRTSPLIGTALIEFASGQADPAEVQRFERIVAELVDEEIVAPTCDLAAAEARLDN